MSRTSTDSGRWFGWMLRVRRGCQANRHPGSDRMAWLRLDLVAGLAAVAIVIPKAIAYSTIAGLPVQVGLYRRSCRTEPRTARDGYRQCRRRTDRIDVSRRTSQTAVNRFASGQAAPRVCGSRSAPRPSWRCVRRSDVNHTPDPRVSEPRASRFRPRSLLLFPSRRDISSRSCWRRRGSPTQSSCGDRHTFAKPVTGMDGQSALKGALEMTGHKRIMTAADVPAVSRWRIACGTATLRVTMS